MPQDLDQGLSRSGDNAQISLPLPKPMSCEDCYRAGVVEGTAAAKQDTESLERLYARALDRVGTLEKTVTEVQIECTKLLEENRKLRSAAGSDPFYCQCCAMYECDCSVAR